jgi:predicted CoA-substrate-specific enzyme activase
MTKLSLGICIGASTISFVKVKEENGYINVFEKESIPHEGNPKLILSNYFNKNELSEYSVFATGRKFKNLINTESVSEPEAIEEAIKYLKLTGKDYALASLGGENFIVYCIDENGNVKNVLTGNKCASGTGEFFLQQIRRMDLSASEAIELSDNDNPYLVSGRCSVFCKSDCTHALNKGIPKGKVVAGLSKMIANKTIELLTKQNSKNIILVGGVSHNKSVVKYIKEIYPNVTIPKESSYIESLGAGLIGLQKYSKLDKKSLFRNHTHNFPILEPISNGKPKVIFKTIKKDKARDGDRCILGLDVGSTTTKAVIIRVEDNAILASEYLRTNGNPVQASINCYKKISEQLNSNIEIIGLGTTGSGRHIAALHALSKGVINEIIAHAVASAYFDKDVDTIFEIGGQDAKYTHLTNGVASDYAMNEACSAGTGSFLEEASKETLNINFREISDIAFTANHPLNFNDQCAAFISSDIKNASHEGVLKEDIVAGLVYSICMNYINRVKGNRTIGQKIFMQGGVCYNKAVPCAMANLINKTIIVPPEPGLMGAFGVALEIKKRIELGLLEKQIFNLYDLIHREFKYGNEFICAGGKEKCDRKCGIAMIEVEEKNYPFGGACNKYYNERLNIICDSGKNDFVNIRQELIFTKCVNDYRSTEIKSPVKRKKTVGISRSLLTNTLYPFYFNFFTKLDFEVVLSDKIEKSGIDKIQSSFCYPVEISHGYFQNLINKKTDYIFLPHITQMESNSENQYNRLCVFVQGECYFLKSTFRDEYESKIISPVIDFASGKNQLKYVFSEIGKELSKSKAEAESAFEIAFEKYMLMQNEFKQIGEKVLKELAKDENRFAMVLFGRSYNAFAKEANLNIPHKFASKNITILPHDFLPGSIRKSYENMYWYSGNQILSNARFVAKHKQLFGVYITNFSCGPDSFILSYFRRIMGDKPSLTLELDSHSADVGIETRIDAALDIIKNYNILKKDGRVQINVPETKPLSIVNEKNRITIIDDENKKYRISSNNIEVLIPSMGHYSSDAFAAVFRSLNINCLPLPVPTFDTLKQGRGLTTCKECLPFILTTGSLTEYIEKNYEEDKKVLFFMPHGYGPCRQGQYFIMLKEIINKIRLKNVGILSMDDENAFDDFGPDFFKKQWIALLISDIIHDIESVIMVLSLNKEESLRILNREWNKIISSIETGKIQNIYYQLSKSSLALSLIRLKTPLSEAKVISLLGEIYVRREEFSRSEVVKTLTEKGFIIKTAPITEYVYYTNYLIKNNIVERATFKDKSVLMIKEKFQKRIEKKIKKILSQSNLYEFEMIDIDKTLNYGKDLVSDKLIGEGILTVGLAMRDILDNACGVISIGPFNCIPSRLSESILNKEMTLEGKLRARRITKNGYPDELSILPFLYVETDGNAFPQITQSKLEIFMLQAEKAHKLLKKSKSVESLNSTRLENPY